MDFLQELEGLLGQVPRGRVTSFRAIGEALGDVKAAKAVYVTLQDDRVQGWHRVVKADGSLPFPEAVGPLTGEGIRVSDLQVEGIEKVHFADFRSERPLEALRKEQRKLAAKVILEDALETPETVAGFDLSYQGTRAYVASVVLDWDSLEVVEEASLTTKAPFPYISTYLAYREFEPVYLCHQRLKRQPSLLLVDGNGTLHPARFGIACLVGVRLEQPTIGVAKSLLMGTVSPEPEPGGASPVLREGKLLGYAYRPGRGRPIFISPGHKVSPSTALELVKRLCKERIPEPLRLAHLSSRRMRRGSGA